MSFCSLPNWSNQIVNQGKNGYHLRVPRANGNKIKPVQRSVLMRSNLVVDADAANWRLSYVPFVRCLAASYLQVFFQPSRVWVMNMLQKTASQRKKWCPPPVLQHLGASKICYLNRSDLLESCHRSKLGQIGTLIAFWWMYLYVHCITRYNKYLAYYTIVYHIDSYRMYTAKVSLSLFDCLFKLHQASNKFKQCQSALGQRVTSLTSPERRRYFRSMPNTLISAKKSSPAEDRRLKGRGLVFFCSRWCLETYLKIFVILE